MNFLELCQYVADNSDQTAPSTVYNADLSILSRRVRRWRGHVNSAYTLIKQGLGHRNEYVETEGTFNTVGGSEVYSIPSGILTVQQLKVNDDVPLRLIPWTEYERYKADALVITITGSPSVACIYNRQIYLYPTPDAGYTVTIRGLQSLTSLDQDTDEPDLAEEFHQAIADLALYHEMVYEGNPAAGALMISENGELNAQVGQAAKAVALYRMAKKNIRRHVEDSPRMISRGEMARISYNRRITRV